jgi:hypothetical protein
VTSWIAQEATPKTGPNAAAPNSRRTMIGDRVVATRRRRFEGLIEIVLPQGVRLRVDAQVDEHALRRVLGALEGR